MELFISIDEQQSLSDDLSNKENFGDENVDEEDIFTEHSCFKSKQFLIDETEAIRLIRELKVNNYFPFNLPIVWTDYIIFPGEFYPIKFTKDLLIKLASFIPKDLIWQGSDFSCPLFFGLFKSNIKLGILSRVELYENDDDSVFLFTKGMSRIAFENISVFLQEQACDIVHNAKLLIDKVPSKPTKLMLANVFSIPSFVYNIFDALRLSEQVINLGGVFFLKNKDSYSPLAIMKNNPQSYESTLLFSHWFAKNLPLIDQTERSNLLRMDNVVERLVKIIDWLKKFNNMEIFCKCIAKICDFSNIIALSKAGVLCSYINRNGYVHQILTISHSTADLFEDGDPQVEHSYFPGYSWTCLYCTNCFNMLGWKFNAVSSSLSNTFIGLLQSQLMPIKNRESVNNSG